MKALVSNRSLIPRLANLGAGITIGGRCGEVKDVPIPDISDDEILVKVRAVALNPTDFKHLDGISPPNAIIGCDYAGEVAKAGRNAAKTWKVGDRVAGVVHGGLYPDRGAFAEYLKMDADLAWHVPAEVDDVSAATYGVSAVTAMLALNVRLGLPWADEKRQTDQQPSKTSAPSIFIYAGSTSAGLLTIQLAKAAGYTVVTTASPRSFDLVKGYGADGVFDYKSPTVVEDIIKEYPDISAAVDCFSEGKSTEICDEVIRNRGGKVLTLLRPGKSKVPGVQNELILAYTLFGHAFQWLPPVGPKFEAIPSDRAALARFFSNLPGLTKTIKPPPITLIEGGFDGIQVGLDRLRAGQVSGSKLVVKL